mmetsp:Transcript_31866/g.101670  ORF Transcript_31866/g.101670 Transcript_31866/m.101670 type:complete len:200 (-) Transcript_31866:2741-3340(-)
MTCFLWLLAQQAGSSSVARTKARTAESAVKFVLFIPGGQSCRDSTRRKRRSEADTSTSLGVACCKSSSPLDTLAATLGRLTSSRACTGSSSCWETFPASAPSRRRSKPLVDLSPTTETRLMSLPPSRSEEKGSLCSATLYANVDESAASLLTTSVSSTRSSTCSSTSTCTTAGSFSPRNCLTGEEEDASNRIKACLSIK